MDRPSRNQWPISARVDTGADFMWVVVEHAPRLEGERAREQWNERYAGTLAARCQSVSEGC